MTEIAHEDRIDDGYSEDGIAIDSDERANWERIRDAWSNLGRRRQLYLAGATAVLSLVGLVGGRFLLKDDGPVEAHIPKEDKGIVTGAGPGGIVAPGTDNEQPNALTWKAECTAVYPDHRGNSRFVLRPVFTTQAGPANPNFLYTLVSYTTLDNPNQQVTAVRGLNAVDVNLKGAFSLVLMAGVYFPNPDNQPGSAAEVPPGPDMGLRYPEAVIVPCEQLYAEPEGSPTRLVP